MSLHRTQDLIDALEAALPDGHPAIDEGRRLLTSGPSDFQAAIIRSGKLDEASFIQIMVGQDVLEGSRDLDQQPVADEIVKRLNTSYFDATNTLPILLGGTTVALATAHPFDAQKLDEVGFLLGEEIKPWAVPSNAIRAKRAAWASSSRVEHELSATEEVFQYSSETVRIVDDLFADAIAAGASDIHIAPHGHGVGVRFRVNGVLQTYTLPTSADPETFVSRIKVLSGMNVSERRLPQDGRILRRFSGRQVELRIASLPTVLGEALTCRLLDPETLKLGWRELGFSKERELEILKVLDQPAGLFLVSGPTGSGKTTTIYTALEYLNTGRKKIITVEDPVEYDLPGLEQVQINPAAGADFATILRASLRHDPDVLMIGEIRDEETARIACRAALVGRLVLATVHAKSIEAVKDRMYDFGVSQNLLEQVMLATLSQRLEPVRCPNCRGDGCTNCGHLGISGRRMASSLSSGDVF